MVTLMFICVVLFGYPPMWVALAILIPLGIGVAYSLVGCVKADSRNDI